MNTKIRKATLLDLPQIFQLVKDLAEYENAPQEVTANLELYEKCFSDKIFECLVAEYNGKIAGTCIYYMTFSTWKGKMLYMEDFVVKEEHRGKGIGQLLYDKYLQIAKEKGCALAKWQVLDWNKPAIDFYKKNNATIEKEWWNVKVVF
jgi:GNAT superfamily N-acetyltransferase